MQDKIEIKIDISFDLGNLETQLYWFEELHKYLIKHNFIKYSDGLIEQINPLKGEKIIKRRPKDVYYIIHEPNNQFQNATLWKQRIKNEIQYVLPINITAKNI